MDVGANAATVELVALMTREVSFPSWGHLVVLELSTTRTHRRPAAKLVIPIDYAFVILAINGWLYDLLVDNEFLVSRFFGKWDRIQF